MRYINLSGADLRYADLRHADLRGANLQGADLRHATLTRANLEKPIYVVPHLTMPTCNPYLHGLCLVKVHHSKAHVLMAPI
ncbi:pentapeptide repeat-containing protein [Nitrincola sp. A-D6]|uniref:pentapeptide repeat-containing protein n=1 Tax=Nitrincola sp. A-D6 TaxID=1545442 RepID=UPI001F27FB9F|nr:pentapeptide repeat-containing protein [Nitrincola sp. A-D6]